MKKYDQFINESNLRIEGADILFKSFISYLIGEIQNNVKITDITDIDLSYDIDEDNNDYFHATFKTSLLNSEPDSDDIREYRRLSNILSAKLKIFDDLIREVNNKYSIDILTAFGRSTDYKTNIRITLYDESFENNNNFTNFLKSINTINKFNI